MEPFELNWIHLCSNSIWEQSNQIEFQLFDLIRSTTHGPASFTLSFSPCSVQIQYFCNKHGQCLFWVRWLRGWEVRFRLRIKKVIGKIVLIVKKLLWNYELMTMYILRAMKQKGSCGSLAQDPPHASSHASLSDLSYDHSWGPGLSWKTCAYCLLKGGKLDVTWSKLFLFKRDVLLSDNFPVWKRWGLYWWWR